MYLADCHNHSICSADSRAPLADMAAAAVRAGLSELCTTDHLDLIDRQGKVQENWDWVPLLEQFEQVKHACPKSLELRLGIEIGSAQFFPDWAGQLLEQAPLDLVIGTAHNMAPARGGLDFIELFYADEATCYTALDDYFESLLALSQAPQIDVLGHLPYTLRYMNDRDGNNISLERYAGQITQILTNLIDRGAGLEVNTNRMRGDMVRRWRPILEEYRRLGGEILTLGSDAHCPEHVGLGIAEAVELLRDLDFRYYSVYRRRKPEFIPL